MKHEFSKEDPYYLSFGGGVNSTALYFLLMEQGYKFEAVYVDHGADYPETQDFVKQFASLYPLTILKASVTRKGETYSSLYEFCEKRGVIPQQFPRWCTGDWKKQQIYEYVKKPCYMAIGIDAGEPKRIKMSTQWKVEYTYPLFDAGIDRRGCKALIIEHGMQVPPKSGCWICPFQRPDQWAELKKNHSELFRRAEQMELNSGRTFMRTKQTLKECVAKHEDKVSEVDTRPCICGG